MTRIQKIKKKLKPGYSVKMFENGLGVIVNNNDVSYGKALSMKCKEGKDSVIKKIEDMSELEFEIFLLKWEL